MTAHHDGIEASYVISPMLAQHLSDAVQRWHRAKREAGGAVPEGVPDLARFLAAQGLAGRSVRLTGAHTVSVLDGAQRGADRVRNEPAPRELLTYREAADRMRISRSTLTRRISAGALTPVRHGGVARLRTCDVDALGGAQ